ncbi:MAG: putative lipid II flippase FtsW [Arachnia sp.]
MAHSDVAASPARPTSAPTPAPAASMRAFAASPLADYYLTVLSVAILSVLGILMVLSASSVLATAQGDSPYYYTIRHLAFLVVGVTLAVAITRIPPDVMRRFGWVAWGAALVALLLVLSPLGHEYQGNQNWINIGPVRFQPSEFAKLALIVWAASLYHGRRGKLHEPFQLLVPFIPGAAVLLWLILAGKDLGTGMVVGLVIVSLMFFVGTPFRLLLPLIAGAAGLVGLLVAGSPSRFSRILVFLDPQSNTDLSSQPMAALYALASGGWWGLGLGASKQKWGGLKNAAHTDFIFAVIGEELGLFGVLVVLAMFALLAKAGLSVALKSDKIFNRIAAAGITAWFLIQALINIGVVMHLLPVLGVPLPFISSGGSALLSNLIAVGVLLSIARDTPDARRHLAKRRRRRQPRMTSVLAAGSK